MLTSRRRTAGPLGLLPGTGPAHTGAGAPQAPRTLASIDVGSNSIKLLVARAAEGDHLEVVAREKTMVRLGHETLQTGRLSQTAMSAGVECIVRFAALARAAGAERILCVATCAVREAANAADFAQLVKAGADLDVEVISGEEEARLITRAVRSDFAPSADPLLVIDIGGGSTEVILSSGPKIRLAESLELGAVRLTDRFVTADPVSATSVRALLAEVDARARRVARTIRASSFRTAVGTSGTIAALAAAAAALEGRELAAAGHATLRRKALRRLVKRLVAAPLRERLRMPGADGNRADIAAAGGLLLLRLLQRFGVRELVVCDRSLREGLILDVLDRLEGGSAPAALGELSRSRNRLAEGRDVRRESVRRLARRAQLEEGHALKTAQLALRLFDATHTLHQLADREREWLEHAAYLHDVGLAVGYGSHHRHSEYLISHGELKGFAAEEVAVIAQLARYHRKGRPRLSHPAFARLDPWLKPIVEKLAALLRLADALDRTQRQVVSDVEVEIQRRRVQITLHVSGSPELELWAAARKGKLFARVFGRGLDVNALPASLEAAPQTASADRA